MTSTNNNFNSVSDSSNTQTYEPLSNIIQRNNAALKIVLTDLQQKIEQIATKVFGEQKDNTKEIVQKTIVDLLTRLDIANDIGFINLQPLITILKTFSSDLYEPLGLNLEADNCIVVLCNYLNDSISLRVVQNILPEALPMTESAQKRFNQDQIIKEKFIAEALDRADEVYTDSGDTIMSWWIKHELLDKKSVKTAIDLLEELWLMSLPKSEFNTTMIGLDADGTGILACKNNSFNLDDLLWRYIIDSLSVKTKTILLLASWRICHAIDKRDAKSHNTIEFFPMLAQIVQRISALGYNFEFNPALLIDLFYQQQPGSHFNSSEEKYLSQDKPIVEPWPDKLIFIFYHLHHLNLIKANDKVLYILIDDTKEIIDRLDFMLTSSLTKIPKQVTVALKHFTNDTTNPMHEPIVTAPGLGKVEPNICNNTNLFLYFSCLADQVQNSDYHNYWFYHLNQTFCRALDFFKNILAQDQKIPSQDEFLQKLSAVATQDDCSNIFVLLNLHDLLQFICAGWHSEKQDLALPEYLTLNYSYFCYTILIYLNGIAVYLHTAKRLTDSKEIKAINNLIYNAVTINDEIKQTIAEYDKKSLAGDHAASLLLAYINAKTADEKGNYSAKRIQQIEQLYIPALLAKKTVIPVDLCWNLLIPYQQSLRVTTNVWLLLEKLYAELFALLPKSEVRVIASASSSSVTSSSVSTTTSAITESIQADTTTTLPANHTTTVGVQTLFFAANSGTTATPTPHAPANTQVPNDTPKQNVTSDTKSALHT